MRRQVLAKNGPPNTVEVVSTKDSIETLTRLRDGLPLHPGEIRRLVESYMREETTDAQMAAFLMAANIRGLDDAMTAELTGAMVNSGKRLRFSAGGPVVDKHSTGGIGDKTSLLLAPMLAAVGARVPMLSGRGLGHTGGTLDKLESIPGFLVDLDDDTLQRGLDTVGAVIAAAGSNLAPADRRLYALRDSTATVPSIALIAASIMSKKIAEGTDALVLDVKHGSGAFITDPTASRRLAETMVHLGESAGVRTSALLTSMEHPLGRMVGNALEVTEIRDALAGGGPADLLELTAALAREMAELAGIDDDPVDTLADGRAMDRWRRLVRNQGGDPDAELPGAPVRAEVLSREAGQVAGVDALGVGLAAWRLGAGRSVPGEKIDHRVGVELCRKPGEAVTTGEVLAVVHAATEEGAARAVREVLEAYTVSGDAVTVAALVTGRVTS
jgi:thymidine phosphorylase